MFSVFTPFSLFSNDFKNCGGKWVANRLNHTYKTAYFRDNKHTVSTCTGLMELISQAPELKERVNTFINNECGGAFKDSYDILTSYVEQYGIYDFGGLAEILYEVIKEVEEIDLLLCTDSGGKTYLIYTPSYPWTPKTEKEKELTEEKLENMFRKYLRIVTDEQLPVDYKSVENFS